MDDLKSASVEVIREWINREADYRVVAIETANGFFCSRSQGTAQPQMFYGDAVQHKKKTQKEKVQSV